MVLLIYNNNPYKTRLWRAVKYAFPIKVIKSEKWKDLKLALRQYQLRKLVTSRVIGFLTQSD